MADQKELLTITKTTMRKISMKAIILQGNRPNCSFISELLQESDLKKEGRYFQIEGEVPFLEYRMRIWV